VRDNDHSVRFIESASLMQWVSLPEDISQSVPYSPRTFARVHFEGPVSTYAVIKAVVDTRVRGCKPSPSDLNRLIHAPRIPVVFDEKVVHGCLVPPEAVLGTLCGHKLRFAPEGEVAASPLFVCFALVLPFSAHRIAFDPEVLYFMCDSSLLLPEFPNVEDHLLVHALPLLRLQFDGHRQDRNNRPHGDEREDTE